MWLPLIWRQGAPGNPIASRDQLKRMRWRPWPM